MKPTVNGHHIRRQNQGLSGWVSLHFRVIQFVEKLDLEKKKCFQNTGGPRMLVVSSREVSSVTMTLTRK